MRGLLFGLLPARIRVELADIACDFRGLRAEILLINDAVLIHDEANHAAAAIHGRVGNQREAIAHLAVDDIAAGGTLGGGAFAGQDAEEVAVVRRGLPLAAAIAFGRSLCGELAQRAQLLGVLGLPVKTVLLTRRAGKFLGIHAGRLAVMSLAGIVLLRVDVGLTELNGGQLIAPDTTK